MVTLLSQRNTRFVSKVFRCTRNSPYKCSSSLGKTNILARQGYFINAVDEADAKDFMSRRFPEDIEEYGTADAAFTAQEQ